MRYFIKRYHPPGTPPGTLAGPAPPGAATIRVTVYGEDGFSEEQVADPAECARFLAATRITWTHVQGPVDAALLQRLREVFKLHPLAVEDVLNSGQRPKLESYDDHLFAVMSLPVMREDQPVTEQVSLFLGHGFVLSFHPGAQDPFEPVRRRLRGGTGSMRGRGADYLVYALMDLTVDQGFPLLEELGERIEDLEEELLRNPAPETLREIHRLKRELLFLRRMLWPQREVINSMLRDGDHLIREETRLYLRDCYDHTIQIMDLLESYRDMTAGMVDVYLSSVSNRLNDVMRVLTIIATIFIPLTFITGIYGMNFGNNTKSPWAMPELNWYYGYPAILLVLLAVALLLLLFFKRKGWL